MFGVLPWGAGSHPSIRSLPPLVRYPCDECDYVATQSRIMKSHKESKHEGVRYLCDKCDFVATHRASLKIHKESKHERVRYSCDKCE